MRSGEKYLVKYRIPGVHRVPRLMLASFMGVEDNTLLFSGRPVFGTSSIRKEWVLETSFVPVTDPRQPFADQKER